MYLPKTHHPGKKALKFPVPSYLIGMLARNLVLMGGTLRKRNSPRFSPQPTYPPISGSIKVPITDIVRYQSLFVFCSWNALISASLLAYFGEDNRFTAQFLRIRNCFPKCTNFPTNFSAAIFLGQEYWIIYLGALFFILFSLDFPIAVNKWWEKSAFPPKTTTRENKQSRAHAPQLATIFPENSLLSLDTWSLWFAWKAHALCQKERERESEGAFVLLLFYSSDLAEN